MKITSAKQLSTVLKEHRTQSKQSQTDVAKNVGLRQDTVSNFERNPESTKLATLFRLLASMELELEVHPRQREVKGWEEEW